MDTIGAEDVSQPSAVSRFFLSISQRFQVILDRTVPHGMYRWLFTALLALTYALRVYLLQGWYIVTYALGIYILNLFIGFLTPRIDPSTQNRDFFSEISDEDEDAPGLPTKRDEEFKPFIRKLPEFKFWYSCSKSIVIGTFCTFFEMFNVPVFWPILVMYFCILFVLTMKRQIKHMIKYRYLPFTHGKRKYQGKPDDTMMQ